MNDSGLNRSERAILEQMASGHPEEGALRGQLSTAKVTSRERTGHGFYCNLDVARDARFRLTSRRPSASAWAHVKGLRHGMTFLLWVDSVGYLASLEGAGFGEDIDTIDFTSVRIEFYDVPEGRFAGFQAPPPSWGK